MSKFAAILNSVGLSTAPAALAVAGAGGGEPTQLTGDQLEKMLQDAHDEGHKVGLTAGSTAEMARMSAVMSSDAGKANPSMAAWMLEHNPTATAEAINTKLADLPKPAAVLAEAPAPKVDAQGKPIVEAPAGAALTNDLGGTPLIELGSEHNNGGEPGQTEEDTRKMHEESRARVFGSSVTTGGTQMFNGGKVARPDNN